MRTALFCPFTAGTVLWQAESGAWTLSVCVRGTFALAQGREAILADAQEPVTHDLHEGNDAHSSLRAASELVPYKPRVDVVLVGSAFAPHHEPTEALVARLAIGSIDKSIGIIGDRVWIDGPDGLEPGAPTRFTTMPLVYERAARGRDNPHGFDLTARSLRGALALPNLENADDRAGGGAAGFGPLASSAAERRGLLRPEGLEWASSMRGPAPSRLDFTYFNAAPRDQQLDAVKAGESLVLENLNREHPRLETRLPAVRPRAFIVPPEVERGFEIPLRVDTVWIDSDRALLTLSWRGLATVDTPDEDALGSLVVAAESKGREVGYAQIAKLVQDGGMSSTDGDTFTDSGTLSRIIGDSIAATSTSNAQEVDFDLMPTPGPFRPKRPLPQIGDRSRAPKPLVASPEESFAAIIDELTGSDLIEVGPYEDPQTITRTDARPPAPAPATRFFEAGDYARIAASAERGDVARALYVYGLTVTDLAGVERSYAERAGRDPAFAEEFSRALETARRG